MTESSLVNTFEISFEISADSTEAIINTFNYLHEAAELFPRVMEEAFRAAQQAAGNRREQMLNFLSALRDRAQQVPEDARDGLLSSMDTIEEQVSKYPDEIDAAVQRYQNNAQKFRAAFTTTLNSLVATVTSLRERADEQTQQSIDALSVVVDNHAEQFRTAVARATATANGWRASFAETVEAVREQVS